MTPEQQAEAQQAAAQQAEELRKKKNREKVQRHRDRKKEEARPKTVEERLLLRLDREWDKAENDGTIQKLVSELYNVERQRTVDFLADRLEEGSTEYDMAIDDFLEPYEHRATFGPAGSHPLSFAWSFDIMKVRLSQFKLGRLLLKRYGQTKEEWQTNRPGKQDA